MILLLKAKERYGPSGKISHFMVHTYALNVITIKYFANNIVEVKGLRVLL